MMMMSWSYAPRVRRSIARFGLEAPDSSVIYLGTIIPGFWHPATYLPVLFRRRYITLGAGLESSMRTAPPGAL
jgi:hypothetical protein